MNNYLKEVENGGLVLEYDKKTTQAIRSRNKNIIMPIYDSWRKKAHYFSGGMNFDT